jgi:hypothetical protein
LTLTLGLRFDYQFARTETQDRYSSFDPNTPNPGAGGLPGAMLFAGDGAGRTGRRTFEEPDHDAWGPRFGFAYRLGDKMALRGGYGMYYSGISFDQFIGQPTIGYQSNPTVPNISNGRFAAFSLDQGFPATNPACANSNCVNPPPFIDPSVANNTSPIAVAKNGLTLPRYQNWSLTLERELTNNMVLDVSYIANRGTRLTADWQKMGVLANMNPSSVLQTYTHDELQGPPTTLPYTGFTGNLAQSLRSFPQYQNILWRNVPIGSSMYNALEVVLEKRFSQGLQFRLAYTYSRLYNDGSESGQGGDAGANGAVQDPSCPHVCEWGLSRDDTPHVFLAAYTWEVPGTKRFKGATGFLLGGWNLSGILRYESGRPLNITMDNPLGGLLFNGQRRPNRVKGVEAVTRDNFNPNDPTQRYFNASAWEDPGVDPTTNNPLFGNAPRRDGSVRAFPTYNEDLSVFKVFPIRESFNMRFEAQFGNIFNRTDFCDPNTFFGPSSFGTVNTQCNQPRSIQFGLRLNY